ncbi:FAD/NAD(P)-binding domain-containing protein [Leucogyrophana mollusca]|uniref:FAD/NAD(P)-binding domain-containing protein n=1 Tax=Leucogyrophana mollusca TaxID=85980 RepID=A0ACB8C1H7_9AGAM|nr:FAD/NAD(P)-binding domain-containing protein [Leucogyrophana mollusca]
MSLPDSTTVLIVGAGPTGLAAALSLTRHGCHDFVIVDAVSQGENSSRAIMIHAATLEALDTIGCGEAIAQRGVKSQDISIRNRTSEILHASFSSLNNHTSYPCAVFLPQNITESLLGERLRQLGVNVHRPKRVAGMRRNEEDHLVTDVSFDDGTVIKAKYVIGADGARSVVRTLAGIRFRDPDGDNAVDHNLAQMILADVTFDGQDTAEVGFIGVMSPESFFFCIPLPSSFNKNLERKGQTISKPIHRIGCGVPISEGAPPSSPPKEFLQSLVDRFGPTYLSATSRDPMTPKVDQVVWSTRFRTHSAIADKTFIRLGSNEDSTEGAKEGGVILLIGDAAHIHSPAGGQGMNLGLRDAIFLGEVVAKHIEASASEPPSVNSDKLLQDFAAVRHARALEVIALTKKILGVAGLKYETKLFWWLPVSLGTVRDWVLWALGKSSRFQGKLVWQLSGLGAR